jgi:SAM-dependent methyltransferase
VDISDEQLAVGQQFEQNRGVDIECIQGDFVDVQELPAATYDLVLSVCALEYAEDIDVVFGGVYESLKPSGRFIFSQTHPIMQALDAGELSPEDNAPSNYSYRGVVEWKWKQDDDFSFISYRRPLSDIVNALTNCGLRIEKTLDLYPLKSNPEWGAVESEIRNRWPSVLVMVSSKS